MIQVFKGDITTVEDDAIVNAANPSLLGGGGVDGAIHRVGGPSILEECKAIRVKQGKCPTGESVITNAGKLPAKYVIHTVGPVWEGGNKNEAALLAACYKNSLELCVEHNIKSVAFPNISTGIYGYPKEEAAEVAITAVKEYLDQNKEIQIDVSFVCFDEENYELYQKLLEA